MSEAKSAFPIKNIVADINQGFLKNTTIDLKYATPAQAYNGFIQKAIETYSEAEILAKFPEKASIQELFTPEFVFQLAFEELPEMFNLSAKIQQQQQSASRKQNPPPTIQQEKPISTPEKQIQTPSAQQQKSPILPPPINATPTQVYQNYPSSGPQQKSPMPPQPTNATPTQMQRNPLQPPQNLPISSPTNRPPLTPDKMQNQSTNMSKFSSNMISPAPNPDKSNLKIETQHIIQVSSSSSEQSPKDLSFLDNPFH